MDSAPAKHGFDWAKDRGERWLARLEAMEGMLAPVDAPLLDAARLNAPLRIADVACGGGGTTLKLQAQAPEGSQVHGFDLSPALVEAARARVAPGSALPTFSVADLSVDPPPGPPFDRLVSRFGVMFFDAPLVACRNLLGWLRPGGHFAFAVWGEAAANPWTMRVREVVERHVAVPPPVPDAPGPFRYGASTSLPALLEQAGFEDLAARTWRGPLQLGGGMDAPAAARFALEAFSFAAPLKDAAVEVQQKALAALTEVLVDHLVEGQVELGACVWLVTGRRPG